MVMAFVSEVIYQSNGRYLLFAMQKESIDDMASDINLNIYIYHSSHYDDFKF